MPDTTALSASPTIMIRPWADPVVDEEGHDPRSRYVELFWLGVLGPTATWLVRRLAAGLDRRPEGYELDLAATAREMGLGFTVGRAGPFTKALQRCVMFGLAHPVPTGLAVRRRVPTIAHRHLKRMPESVRAAHDEWQRTTISVDELARAHQLGLALIEAGGEPGLVEHQLIALGVRQATAAEVADNLARLEHAS